MKRYLADLFHLDHKIVVPGFIISEYKRKGSGLLIRYSAIHGCQSLVVNVPWHTSLTGFLSALDKWFRKDVKLFLKDKDCLSLTWTTEIQGEAFIIVTLNGKLQVYLPSLQRNRKQIEVDVLVRKIMQEIADQVRTATYTKE